MLANGDTTGMSEIREWSSWSSRSPGSPNARDPGHPPSVARFTSLGPGPPAAMDMTGVGLIRRPAHRDKAAMNGAQPLKVHGDSTGLRGGPPAVVLCKPNGREMRV